MTEKCASQEYRHGVNVFKRSALIHMRMSKEKVVRCLCRDCKNHISWDNIVPIEQHLILRGFMDGYTCWTKHGEVPTESQGSCEMANPVNDMADPDNEVTSPDNEMVSPDIEMEQLENEMPDRQDDMADDGGDCDDDGDDEDMHNMRAMLLFFRARMKFQKSTRSLQAY